ncbi:hypothetical protein D9615_005731 [Tricholomella constricta]|uniref:Uncharacterized protein n=1 Tax=Tricholomella constricta TaxID=117010 RepID=A0A8H5HAY4_9AGAR|nr:hypothetical protein D9615_005731 [Tricholomella constricta]
MDYHPTGRSKSGNVLLPASGDTVSLSNTKMSGKPSLQERNLDTATPNYFEVMDCLCAPGASLNNFGAPAHHLHNNASSRRQPLRGGDKDQRRLQRYLTAEGKLARQFQQCQSETPSRELQVQALERATTMLNTHALDARERVENLRTLLADRSMDPDTYESLKRERWVEENRQSVVDQETKVVRQHLDSLSNHLTHGDPLSGFRATHLITDEERRRRNLLKFFDASPTQPSIRIRKATSLLFERAPKRRTLNRVSPMRLRTTSTISNASFQPLLPISRDGWTRRPRHITNPGDVATRETSTLSLPPPLKIVTEDRSMAIDEDLSPYTETEASYVSKFTDASSTSPTTAITCSPPLLTSRLPMTREKPDSSDETGTATIYLSSFSAPPTGQHLTAEDVEVSLPDYALDLFSRFDYALPISISDTQISGRLPTRSSDVGPRQAKQQRNAASMRHSSSSLKVPLFASPKQQQGEKAPRLGRSSSSRQLGSLFSIPEALSSRIGVESSEKSARGRDGFASSTCSSATSHASPTRSKEVKSDLTSKLKRRFSVLRLGRS